MRRLGAAFAIAVLGITVMLALKGTKPVLAPFGVGLALYLIAGALTDLVERTGLFRVAFGTALRRAGGMPRSFWGTACTHIGLGMTLLGITAETSWSVERIVALKPSDVVAVGSCSLTFEGLSSRDGPNYRDLAARVTVRRSPDVLGVLELAKSSFAARQMTTTVTALMTRGASQPYLALGGHRREYASTTNRLYF